MDIKKIINEEILNLLEVRHVITPYSPNQRVRKTDIDNNEPLRDSESIVVYHGYSKFDEAILAAKFGLSGKERAKRIYSYESGNNPKGLFVSIDFGTVERQFSGGGVIMEFSTKVSNLEAPVWVGGRSYFVQGEYTKSFKDDDERQQQQLANREKHGESEYEAIRNSDRPELAWALFDGPEHQALFIGDLNPNMITGFWVNERLKNDRRTDGQWQRLSRKDFYKRYVNDENLKTNYLRKAGSSNPDYDNPKRTYSDDYYNKESKWFQPAEDFTVEEFKARLDKHGYDYDEVVNDYIKHWDNDMMSTLFYPKQLEQVKKFYGVRD